MPIILTSTSVIASNSKVNIQVVKTLKSMSDDETVILVVSNKQEPDWFKNNFPEETVEFLQSRGRQNGKIINIISDKLKISKHDIVVLGGSDDDVRMSKNGGAVLVSAGWVNNWTPKYGISANHAINFKNIINLSTQWNGSYYFRGEEEWYNVWSLSNVSSFNKSNAQQEWSKKIVNIVKNGGDQLQALLTVLARSMLMSGMADQKELIWGYYPSSASKNDDTDVLSDLTHRLRSVVSRVQYAKFETPLFIRHTPSTKRSIAKSVDRSDPSEQIETIHINPFYKKNIQGRNVVLLDDCSTYGVSFGVASALLKKAGAKSINCFSIGKFGNQLNYYEIDIHTDPFEPIKKGSYVIFNRKPFNSCINNNAQDILLGLSIE